MDISPVSPRRWREAMGYLVAGTSCGLDAKDRRWTIERFVAQYDRRDDVLLWWARRAGNCVAVAMVLQTPGRIGMLLCSPAAHRGVGPPALSELIAAVSKEAVNRGMALVQSLVAPSARDDIRVLDAAGYYLLAPLILMRIDLRFLAEKPEDESLTWRSYGQFGDQELGHVISETYEDSLDCPGLRGLRDIADVIAGHKASGAFRPEAWLIAERDHRPAGCILVNDSPAGLGTEVAYMGVVPARRRAGVGTAMLRRSAALAIRRGALWMTLSVDSGNHYALDLYRSEGFVEESSRLAYVTASASNTDRAR